MVLTRSRSVSVVSISVYLCPWLSWPMARRLATWWKRSPPDPMRSSRFWWAFFSTSDCVKTKSSHCGNHVLLVVPPTGWRKLLDVIPKAGGHRTFWPDTLPTPYFLPSTSPFKTIKTALWGLTKSVLSKRLRRLWSVYVFGRRESLLSSTPTP